MQFDDYHGIEFPAFLRDLGFQDDSYHNDSCGRCGMELASGRYLVVWVDYDDPTQREDEASPKFAIQVWGNREEADPYDLIAETDDPAFCGVFVQQVIQREGRPNG